MAHPIKNNPEYLHIIFLISISTKGLNTDVVLAYSVGLSHTLCKVIK